MLTDVSTGPDLLTRSWGDEVVLFNVAADQVHLLDAFSAAVLDELRIFGRDSAAVSVRLAEALGTDAREIEPRVSELIASFDDLGLTEP